MTLTGDEYRASRPTVRQSKTLIEAGDQFYFNNLRLYEHLHEERILVDSISVNGFLQARIFVPPTEEDDDDFPGSVQMFAIPLSEAILLAEQNAWAFIEEGSDDRISQETVDQCVDYMARKEAEQDELLRRAMEEVQGGRPMTAPSGGGPDF
jgi:hypothetical protein